MTVQKKHLSHPRYRPDIDGLRAIAILGVVAFHAFPDLLKGGFTGVDIFFVISGFLITTIIFDNLEKGTFSFFRILCPSYSAYISSSYSCITCMFYIWLACSAWG